MSTKKLRRFVLFILICGLFCIAAQSSKVRAQKDLSVTEVFLKADVAKQTGKCPLMVKFNGYITANGAGTVKYTFTRSDGATGPTYTLTFKEAGTLPVSTDWTLGGIPGLPYYEGWQAVKVLSPNEMESSHDTGAFTISCAGAPVTSPNQGGNTGQKTPPSLSLPLLKERALVSKKEDITLIPNKNFAGIFIIKFVEGSHIRYKDGNFTTGPKQLNEKEFKRLERLHLSMDGVLEELKKVNELTRDYGERYGFTVTSTFANKESINDPEAQFREKEKLELAAGQELADLDLYFNVAARDFKDMEAQQKFMNELNKLSIIEDVHAAVLTENATVKTDAQPELFDINFQILPTPDLTFQQGYLNPASAGGIDATYAWTKDGGRGNRVKVIDVEFNWMTVHEDFAPATSFFWGNHSICSAIPETDHGTAVMGVLNAPHNGYGVSGISPNIQYGLANICQPAGIPGFFFSLFSGDNILGRTHNIMVARTIFEAAPALGQGDILLIEAHTIGVPSGMTCPSGRDCSQWEYVPMEYYQESFDVIQRATARGVVVVEAAGNGAMDLDAARYNHRLDPTWRHSGALLVGASNGGGNHDRAWFSNYGQRVDVHGWGDFVATLGYGKDSSGTAVAPWNTGNPTRYYTARFGGTSSASPIVAGAVASVQGTRKARGLAPLNGSLLKILFDQAGTPQGSATASQHIGPLPDLGRAIDLTLGTTGSSTGPGGPGPGGTPPTPRGGFTGPGMYLIQARHSGKFLEVFGGAIGGLVPSAPIVQFDNNSGETQKFRIQSGSSGFFTIQSKYSSQCMEVPASIRAPIHLDQWVCVTGSDNQQFAIEPVGGLYRIRVKHSGLYFGILGESFINAAPLMQTPLSGGDRQLFQFIPTS